jgi:hypothetical protein
LRLTTFGFFASHVPVERRVEQTLLLWDRIIGFDDLELLPILAAAIFVYRAKWLLQANEPAHVKRLLAEAGPSLKVVPLLQLFLHDMGGSWYSMRSRVRGPLRPRGTVVELLVLSCDGGAAHG